MTRYFTEVHSTCNTFNRNAREDKRKLQKQMKQEEAKQFLDTCADE